MRLLYKSGMLPKKKALLQYFQPLWFSHEERYSRYYLRELEHVALPYNIQNISLSAAWYVNELIYITQYPGQSEPNLFDAYEVVLCAMSNVSDLKSLERALRRFERELLQSLGQDILLTHTSNDQPIQSSNQYIFVPGDGFILTEKGISGAYILAFANNQLEDPLVLSAVKQIMRRAIDYVLDGKVLKTRALGLSLQNL